MQVAIDAGKRKVLDIVSSTVDLRNNVLNV